MTCPENWNGVEWHHRGSRENQFCSHSRNFDEFQLNALQLIFSKTREQNFIALKTSWIPQFCFLLPVLDKWERMKLSLKIKQNFIWIWSGFLPEFILKNCGKCTTWSNISLNKCTFLWMLTPFLSLCAQRYLSFHLHFGLSVTSSLSPTSFEVVQCYSPYCNLAFQFDTGTNYSFFFFLSFSFVSSPWQYS